MSNITETLFMVLYSTLAYLALRERTPENILDRFYLGEGVDILMISSRILFCLLIFIYVPVNFCPGRNEVSQMLFGTPYKDKRTHLYLSLLFLLFKTTVAIIFPKVNNILSLVSGTVGITLGLLFPVKLYLANH